MHARILVSLVLFALWGLSAKAQYTSDPLDQATVEQFIQANPDTKLKFIAAEKGGMLCKDAAVMARYNTDKTATKEKPTTAQDRRRSELLELIRTAPANAGAYRRELKEMDSHGVRDN